jgi:hypothetical protein
MFPRENICRPRGPRFNELTKLDDDTFQKLRDGSINPEMQRKDVARADRILNRERDLQRVENLHDSWWISLQEYERVIQSAHSFLWMPPHYALARRPVLRSAAGQPVLRPGATGLVVVKTRRLAK